MKGNKFNTFAKVDENAFFQKKKPSQVPFAGAFNRVIQKKKTLSLIFVVLP